MAVVPTRHLPAALALARDRVLTRDDLLQAGLSPLLGDRLVREGAWLRLAPSVWLTDAGPPDDAALLHAAVAHGGPGAVVTGLVTCRAAGLTYAPVDGSVEVLVGEGRRRTSSPHVVVHQTARPPAVVLRGGTRMAAVPRAVVDGARRLQDLRRVRALVCEAVHRGACCSDALATELAEGHSAGSAVVRRALRDACAGAASAPEAELADVAADAHRAGLLPPFLLNPTILLDGRVLGRPDGWFPGLGLGWEVDSAEHHSSGPDFDRTLARHDDFGRHGLALLHVTPRRLRLLGDSYALVLADAVRARRLAAQPEPRGLVVRPYATPS